MPYFDAHLHIVDDDMILRASDKGVRTFFVNAAKMSDWEPVLAQSNRLLGVHPCLGVHPWHLDSATPNWESELRHILKDNPQAMVGEIGLDGMRSDMERQKDFFFRQMVLAEELNRPVHIHCFKAWPEMLEILGQFKGMQILMHRFSGDEVIVQKLRFMNVYFSVLNGKVLDVIPDNRVLVESDAPDGIFTPEAIPALVKKLRLQPDYIWQNLELFLDGR
ncbi:MAG: TatD family hydrolase [Alphaproteobacteria bacterium]|nr:TatD family hydrolase [Alphaproteobacteria bacterium]